MIYNSPAALLALGVLCSACSGKTPALAGYQGVVEYEERVIGFEVPGRIEQVAVRRGDAVKAGDVLSTLDPTLEQLARATSARTLDVAEADLVLLRAGAKREDIASVAADVRAAEATEALAVKNEMRARSLFATATIAQADVDRAEAERGRATFERKALAERLSSLRRGARPEEIARTRAHAAEARSAVASQDERLARHVLRAENDGVVLDVHVKVGELAATGTPAVTLADIGHPYVDLFVPEGELSGVRAGGRATVRVDGSPRELGALVEHVAPRTEFSPKFLFSERERPHLVIRVRVRVDDPEGLLHAGVPAFAKFAR